ncbi:MULTISPECIES: hypothetical protein [unclassified Novosphingobium]|uniref:hypothetical protein n=1 Tax=unclassified Novosphingobium TaxID=2644732 RepID=UPI000ECFC0CF|nr:MULTISPECIES: hypothetical protein [unclassified Novosphingobium]HCF25394.1 hypothetical protein [Novosphingobium sp.]HQV04149.1 hypothetical protein [Novosphingobium sp.]
MPISILEHGLGPILLVIGAPQPVAEQELMIVLPQGRFDLPRALRGPGAGLELAPHLRRVGRYPSDLPGIRVDDGLIPPAIVWTPTSSSMLRIDPAKVHYRLLF